MLSLMALSAFLILKVLFITLPQGLFFIVPGVDNYKKNFPAATSAAT